MTHAETTNGNNNLSMALPGIGATNQERRDASNKRALRQLALLRTKEVEGLFTGTLNKRTEHIELGERNGGIVLAKELKIIERY